MERLSLHQLVDTSAPPEEMIEVAARLDCPTVTLFATHSPNSHAPYVETVAQARALRQRGTALGVGVYSLEVFSLTEDGVTDAMRHGLEVAGELGAQRATACIYDSDTARARDNFAALHEQATAHGVDVHVEFHAFGVVNTLGEARDFLSGVDVPAGISADVLHFYRNEGGLESLLEPQPVPIRHAQLCDGPLTRPRDEWLHEAVADRRVPGNGAFDLLTFLRALPRDVRIDVEIPTPRAAGDTTFDRANAVLSAARRLLAEAADET